MFFGVQPVPLTTYRVGDAVVAMTAQREEICFWVFLAQWLRISKVRRATIYVVNLQTSHPQLIQLLLTNATALAFMAVYLKTFLSLCSPSR